MSITFQIVGDGEPVDEAEAAAANRAVHDAHRRQIAADLTPVQREAAHTAKISALCRMFVAQPNEFALTGGSAVVLEAAMARLGMIGDDYRKPQKPRQKQFGVTAGMVAAWGLGEGESPQVTAYQAAYEKYLAAGAENPTGIPSHKLRGDDNWVINPDEITAALGAYRSSIGGGEFAAPIPPMFWWPYWIKFLDCAAKHPGIRVR